MRILYTLALIVLVVAVTTYFVPSIKTDSQPEGTYERVLRTNTIRCGYASWPPLVVEDINTGKPKGLIIDLFEAHAAKLGLTVEWTENVGWNFTEALKTHRVDAFCPGAWRIASRGKYLLFGDPYFFSPIYAYVSANNTWLKADLSNANTAKVRFSTLDGDYSDAVARSKFPDAQMISLPNLSDPSLLMQNIADGKADILLTEDGFAQGYMTANPGQVKRLSSSPVAAYPTGIAFRIEDRALKDMFDNALSEMQNNGEIVAIIRKSVNPDAFIPVSLPSR